MALPPTFIYKYIKDDAEGTYNSLLKKGLLKKDTKKESFISNIQTGIVTYNKLNSKNTGPNLTDTIAGKTRKFLNKYGLYLYEQEVGFATLMTKIKVRLKLFQAKLNRLLGF